MHIFNLKILTDKKLWLAPLAGYTDQAFRKICKDWGADVVVSEMVSADGILHKQKKTLEFLDFTEMERPFGIQLFGSNPKVFSKAVETVIKYNPDFIDINMGCPAHKVIKRGAGGALMSDISRAANIVKEVKANLNGLIPLSVKFRSGCDLNNQNYLDFGKAMQENGADLVILHPRTVKQAFTGLSNWTHIALLKKELTIPVIGNGDIICPEDGPKMYESTDCDSIMVGRGVLGLPWLFAQIKERLNSSGAVALEADKKIETLFRHIDNALLIKHERIVIKEIRSHICYYTKSLSRGAKLRNEINHTEDIESLKKLLTEAFHERK